MAFFAANSLLARFALRSGEIDAGSFTAVRIGAGAAALVLVVEFRREESSAARQPGSLRAAFALFSYAITFSYAYLLLNAGTGALVLFAAVQMTMLGKGIASVERLRVEWLGCGVRWIRIPCIAGLTAPSMIGVLLMALSGVAWGYYSSEARDVDAPIAATAGNFARAVPSVAGTLMVIWGFGHLHTSWLGIGIAATSGAVTSGLGYAIWYSALRDLRTSHAGIVQLIVPFRHQPCV